MIDDKDILPPEQVDDEIEQVEQEPTDVRSSLKAALKEVSEREDEPLDRETPRDKEKAPSQGKDEVERRLEKARAVKAAKAAERKRAQDSTQAGLPPPLDPKLEKQVKEGEQKPPQDAPKRESPVGYWRSKSKTKWDQLPLSVQEDIIQREREVSDGFAQVGPKVRAFDDMYKVIEPHLPAIQRFGVSVPQTIERLFSWMNALSHPDMNFRVQSFKELARSFNVQLDQTSQEENFNPEARVNEPPSWFQQYHGAVANEIQSLKAANQQQYQQQMQQTQAAAESFVSNWSKDRPHFELVRDDMKWLLETGKIPLLPNGQLDLDGAYNYAVQYNPKAQEQIRAQGAEKAKADAEAKAQADAKASADRLARARRAGSSLRPQSPLIAAAPQGKSNSHRGSTSVRDSLKETLNQLSDQ